MRPRAIIAGLTAIGMIAAGLTQALMIGARVMADSSASYTIDISDLNTGGDTAGSSASFKVRDTFTGPLDGVASSSASFLIQAGLIQLEQYCGNEIVEITEECDDGRHCTNGVACDEHTDCAGIGDNNCVTRSGDGCSNVCEIDVGGAVCGNGVKEGAEQCDLADFGGLTCSNFGFSQGALSCTGACTISTAACSNPAPPPPAGGGGGGGGGGGDTPPKPKPKPEEEPVEEEEEEPDTDVGDVKKLIIIAHPEKRLPATGNWSTTGKVTLYKTADKSQVFTTDITLNSNGYGEVNAETLPDGTYHAAFKGRSHLTKILRNIEVKSSETTLDYTNGNKEFLKAGDVQSGKDNLVNALDLSAIVVAIYTDNIDADLNADKIVNALDLSIAIVNIYQYGETP